MAALPLAAAVVPAVAADPWRWSPHPEVWLIVAGGAAGYWYAVTRIGPRLVPRGTQVVSRRQVTWYLCGLLALWVASDWPIHDLAESYLYSVHMVQHLLISLVAPPMLLLGIPGWLTRWLLRPRWLSGSVRVLARPLVAAVLFNSVIALSHAPFYVNFTLYHHFWHFWAHLLLFVVSMLMWFPVVNQLPEYPRLNPPLKMVYLFLQSVIPNVPVAFLTLSTGVLYSYYAHVPRLPAPFAISAITDQQLAGALMKVGGTALLWSIILVVFFQWYNVEQRQDRAEREALIAASRRRLGASEAEPAAGGDMPEVLTWEHVVSELAKSQPAEPGGQRPPGP
jgi:putative membrane protein